MTQAAQSNHLPSVLAALRQKGLDGELVLEQNDGVRRMHCRQGELVYLQSDAAGEQFGNYLIRRGVLDLAGLNALLASADRSRLGEKVVQTGMMNLDQRDAHLRELQEQVMINALEHPILRLTWTPERRLEKLSEDLHLRLDHRHFIWNTFLEAHNFEPTFDLLQDRTDWKWEGIPGLLEAVSDLPLNPATAYALSFLGSEPLGFDTFLSLSGLPEDEAARIFLILWAVGALVLTQGELPVLAMAAPPAPDQAAPAPAPPEPSAPTPAAPVDGGALDLEQALVHPQFIDLEAEHDPTPEAGAVLRTPEERAHSLYLKAKAFHLQERVGEAIHCLERSVQLDPASAHAYAAWLLLGTLRMSNPAWSTRTINALQAAARLKPGAAEPWVGMGEVYHRKGFRTNAVACFHKALELDPSVPIPAAVDYRELEVAAQEPAPQKSLFSRFRSALGGEKG